MRCNSLRILKFLLCNVLLLSTPIVYGQAHSSGSAGITHPYVEAILLGSWTPPSSKESIGILHSFNLSDENAQLIDDTNNTYRVRLKALRNALYTTLPFNPSSFPNKDDLKHIHEFVEEVDKIKNQYCISIDELLDPEQQSKLLMGATFGRVFQVDPMIASFLKLDATTKAKMIAIEQNRIEKYIEHTHEFADYWKTKHAVRKLGESAPDELVAKSEVLAKNQKSGFHCVAWGIFMDNLDVLTPEQQTKAFNFCGFGVRRPEQALAHFETKVRNILGTDSRAEKILDRFKAITEVDR